MTARPLPNGPELGAKPPHDSAASAPPASKQSYSKISLLVLPAVVWLALFTVAPLVLTFVMSFWKSTIFGTTASWNIDNYMRFLSDPLYGRVLLNTLRIAVVTTLACLLVAYPLAWYLAQQSPTKKAVLLVGIFVPFWVSYIIRTFVWLPILGRMGLVNQLLMASGLVSKPVDWLLYSEFAVYIGLAYVYLLYMLLPIFLTLDKLDRRLLEAARDLGAAPLRIFTRIVLPLSAPGILSGSVMVFLLSCGAYVTPQILGGPSAIMFGNLIAAQFIGASNWAFGAMLSVVFIVVVLLALGLVGRKAGMQRIFLGQT